MMKMMNHQVSHSLVKKYVHANFKQSCAKLMSRRNDLRLPVAILSMVKNWLAACLISNRQVQQLLSFYLANQ